MSQFTLPDYNEWTIALGRYFFKKENAGKRIVLSCDKEALFESFQEYRGNVFSDEEAAFRDFLRVVKEKLKSYNWQWERVIYTREKSNSGENCFGAFLLIIVQILAGYEMSRSSKTGHASYWRCLCEMLNVEQRPSLPNGLSYLIHEKLWRYFVKWVNETQEENFGRLEVPFEVQSSRPYINMPLSQALLRKVDLEKLADRNGFYDSVLWRRQVTLDQLERSVRCCLEPRYFNEHARTLFDSQHKNYDPEIFNLACEQIFEHYHGWLARSQGQTVPLKQEVQHRSELSISRLAGTTPNLKIVVTNGEEVETLSKDQIPRFLSDGGSFGTIPDFRLAFPKLGSPPGLFFYSSAEDQYVHADSIAPGQAGLLFVFGYESVKTWFKDWEQILDARPTIYAGNRKQNMKRLSGLPEKWYILMLRVKENIERIPSPWNRLIQANAPTVDVLTGLRLERNRWMLGTRLRFSVRGRNLPKMITDSEVPHPLRITEQKNNTQEGIYELSSTEEGMRFLTIPENKHTYRVRIAAPDIDSHQGNKEHWNERRWILGRNEVPTCKSEEVSFPTVGNMFGPRIEITGRIEAPETTVAPKPSKEEPVNESQIALLRLLQADGVAVTIPHYTGTHPLIRTLQDLPCDTLQRLFSEDC